MDKQPENEFDEPLNAETPEDVAVLFAWANLHGAKYRDFSASRREYRAQVRHRAAEELRKAELQAQAAAEQSAAEAERAAMEAERVARSSEAYKAEGFREQAMRRADEASRVAAAERVEAARRAEAAAMAEMAARREEREIAEAHASSQRQAARYAESEVRRRSLAGPQPAPALIPGLASDPYVTSQGSAPEVNLYSPNTQLEAVQPTRFRGDSTAGYNLGATERGLARTAEAEARRRPQGYRAEEPVAMRGRIQSRPDVQAFVLRSSIPQEPLLQRTEYSTSTASFAETAGYAGDPQGAEYQLPQDSRYESSDEPVSPAWLYESKPQRPVAEIADPFFQEASDQAAVGSALQQSRERVASRWYALKGSPLQTEDEPVKVETDPQSTAQTPTLAVFSLAGGVGKTSLVATLGRTFSSMGETVLLADTTSHGLLPYYFGASELKPGVVRTFSPPAESPDAAIQLVSYDMDSVSESDDSRAALTREILRVAGGTQQAVLDLTRASSWVIQSLAQGPMAILVPVAPDMNSVISLQSVERFFQRLTEAVGRSIQPHYLINQFDASLPLHLDVREVLRRQLGDRLLSYTIRRSAAVSEALAEGMTVVDYAPGSPVAEDYLNVANWIRTVNVSATQGARNNRWSER